MKVQLHDLVRVAKQPTMQYVRIEGVIAVVTEIDPNDPNYCTIHELQLSGEVFGGHGAVPTDCLEPVDSLPWRAAHAVYKQRVTDE